MNLAKYIGIPYEQKDCFVLLKEFYRNEFQIQLSDYFEGPVPGREELDFIITSNKGKFTQVKEPAYGDIIVIKFYGYSCHVGIWLEEGKFLHTTRGTGSCIDRLDRYKKMIEGFYRHEWRTA